MCKVAETACFRLGWETKAANMAGHLAETHLQPLEYILVRSSAISGVEPGGTQEKELGGNLGLVYLLDAWRESWPRE